MHFLFFPALKNFAELGDRRLRQWIKQARETAEAIAADPAKYIAEGREKDPSFSGQALLAEMEAGTEALEKAKAELASREATAETEGIEDELAALAARAANEDPPAEVEVEEPETAEADTAELAAEEPEVEAAAEVVEPEEAAVEEPIVAAAPVLPAASRIPEVRVIGESLPVALIAAVEGLNVALGSEITDGMALAEMCARKRQLIDSVADGRFPVAQFQWGGNYPASRRLQKDESDMAIVAAAIDEMEIREAMAVRKRLPQDEALTASGGLCAPVTPYYQLQNISQATRYVRGALPGFAADRGGIRAARPAALTSITTGVGRKTAADDAAGGTFATKTCQVVDCPPFTETDVAIIFHCLQFGNLAARTFPERVAQANNLVLAAQARLAEKSLLDGIKAASTAVTANTSGLGATGDLLSQILAAANGMRNRHRMDPEAVLRFMTADWVTDMLISDMQRGQFERFSLDEAGVVALLRSYDIEPTFYIDGSSTGSQIFGAQTAGALLPFPTTVEWALYPEGSFLFLDGGVLELGLVRDSTLNKTNDYQVFGESFENVAFIGVESIWVTSTTCDSGVVAGPQSNAACPTWA